MATDTEFEELIKGLSEEELAAFNYVCNSLDFASTLGKDSYVLNILNTSCSRLDEIVTFSKIVFDNTNKKIIIETVGEVVETIVYETGMVGVKRAALSLLSLGMAEGDPFSIGMGVVTSSGTYIMGSIGLETIAENAGVEAKDIVSKILEINSQEEINQNITPEKIESAVFLDSSTNEKTTFEINQETTVLEPIIVQDLTTGSIVSLKSGQTISHIAANTEFKTMDLLKYNNLTLEQAKNLPVGYEIHIPKTINNFDGGYGNIKLYTAYDGTLTYYIPDDKGNVNVIKINSDGEILQNDFDISGTVLDEIVVNPNDNQSYNDAKTMEELLKDPNNLVKIDDGILYADSGQIKTDVNYDQDSQTLFYEDENGNIQQISYEDNSDLLIYGDVSNPNKITFTDENGDYQVWEKDNEGNFVQTNKVDYSGTLNTAINQIGSLIIMNNQDFSNIEKIAVSTTVSTIADFTTYKTKRKIL